MKQAAFLAALALTRSVREAARRVGMSRETAYRLRSKRGAESFADAWDKVTGPWRGCARKVTPGGMAYRALGMLLKPVLYRGRHVATIEKPDNSALLAYASQLARSKRSDWPSWHEAARFVPHTRSTSELRQAHCQPPLRC